MAFEGGFGGGLGGTLGALAAYGSDFGVTLGRFLDTLDQTHHNPSNSHMRGERVPRVGLFKRIGYLWVTLGHLMVVLQ